MTSRIKLIDILVLLSVLILTSVVNLNGQNKMKCQGKILPKNTPAYHLHPYTIPLGEGFFKSRVQYWKTPKPNLNSTYYFDGKKDFIKSTDRPYNWYKVPEACIDSFEFDHVYNRVKMDKDVEDKLKKQRDEKGDIELAFVAGLIFDGDLGKTQAEVQTRYDAVITPTWKFVRY